MVMTPLWLRKLAYRIANLDLAAEAYLRVNPCDHGTIAEGDEEEWDKACTEAAYYEVMEVVRCAFAVPMADDHHWGPPMNKEGKRIPRRVIRADRKKELLYFQEFKNSKEVPDLPHRGSEVLPEPITGDTADQPPLAMTPLVERVFSEQLERDLQAYPGKWVGISEGVIVAAGDSPGEVFAAAGPRGGSHMLLLPPHFVLDPNATYIFDATMEEG